MKKLLLAFSLMSIACTAFAQELYVNTEPASNMATHSIGIRLENQGYFNPVYKDRTTLEIMYGAGRCINRIITKTASILKEAACMPSTGFYR